MTRKRLLTWSALGLIVAVALWVAQALIGANYYGEQESYPWLLRAMQWAGLGLVLVSLLVLLVATTLLFKRPVD
ncbi:MAG: hypothetical protein ABI649_07580 [Gaiellaceae bacterium]